MLTDWQRERLSLLKAKKRGDKMLTVQELDKTTEELWETAKSVFTLGEEEKYAFGVGVTLALLYISENEKEDSKHNTNKKPIAEIFFKGRKNYNEPVDETPQPDDPRLKFWCNVDEKGE